MNFIRGKQIENNSINQSNMFVETNTIISGTSVTNKQYVIQQINEKSGGIHQSRLNQHMTANNASIGEKACDSAVIEFPISNILIKVNGTIVNVGEGMDCYFSPDGVIIRSNGYGQKGDYLYWNSSKYNLSTDDEIDFNYLVAYAYYTLSGGTSITLNPIYNNLVVRYTGDSGTTMVVIIDNISITVGNVNGNFVWDIGGLDEHTFTSSNESIVVTINGENYTIWFDGFGSLIFSVKKGDFTPISSDGFLYGIFGNNINKFSTNDLSVNDTYTIDTGGNGYISSFTINENVLYVSFYFDDGFDSNYQLNSYDLSTFNIINNIISYDLNISQIIIHDSYIYAQYSDFMMMDKGIIKYDLSLNELFRVSFGDQYKLILKIYNNYIYVVTSNFNDTSLYAHRCNLSDLSLSLSSSVLSNSSNNNLYNFIIYDDIMYISGTNIIGITQTQYNEYSYSGIGRVNLSDLTLIDSISKGVTSLDIMNDIMYISYNKSLSKCDINEINNMNNWSYISTGGTYNDLNIVNILVYDNKIFVDEALFKSYDINTNILLSTTLTPMELGSLNNYGNFSEFKIL